jgi:hypothetical protein
MILAGDEIGRTQGWDVLFDTGSDMGEDAPARFVPGAACQVAGRSLVLLRKDPAR